MNQAWLSQIAIRSLSDSYQAGARYDPEKSFQEACRSLCGEAMGRQLSKHLDLFQGKGLSALDDAMRAALIRIYRRYQQNPYATEVVDWLEGAYGFDPNCLSD